MDIKNSINQTLRDKGYTKKELAGMWSVSPQTIYNRMDSMPAMFQNAVQGLPHKPHGKRD